MKKFILDTLFPIRCLYCGEAAKKWLCRSCYEKISLLSCQVCPYCEKTEMPGGMICPRCKKSFLKKNSKPPLESLVVATKYGEKGVPQLIHAFKYSFIRDLGSDLSELIIKAFLDSHASLPDLIIPVPLHPRRERWRGYNQAKVLAEFFAKNVSPGLPIPIENDFIIRKKFTSPQMKIRNYSERQKNLTGVFGIKNPRTCASIKNSTILLIDDVATTGATLFECSEVLKMAGAKKVQALVVARQEMK